MNTNTPWRNRGSRIVFMLVQFLPSCVFEVGDRNMYGLICLLVHIERNSPYRTEENAISDAKFEELHWSISTLQRRMSYICWRHVDEKIDVKELSPRRFYAGAKHMFWYGHPKKLTAADRSRRQSEDVVFLSFSSFTYLSHRTIILLRRV